MASNATGRKTSSMNDKMYEATGPTAIIGDVTPPGVKGLQNDIVFEELGRLSEFPDLNDVEAGEGTGEHCVVLADYVTGAEASSFVKGQVVRISRLIPGYNDESVDRNLVRGRVKRLLDIRAVRLATSEERRLDKVEVTFESESQTVTTERARRIAAERENEVLRERLGLAHDASIAASPDKAGASEKAQEAVGVENNDTFDDE